MEAEKELYPLAASQKMHYFTLEHCPLKQVLNIGTGLTIEIDIDFDVLKQSIYEAYQRCEAMRLRFCRNENGEVMQYIAPREERDIPFFEFSHWKEQDAENEMKKWTMVPFERFNSPMNKIVMISMPGGYNGMYMCVDHMTMDAQSIVGFYTDVIQIYCSKVYNTEYPKPLESFIKVLKKDLEYEANSKSLERDRRYWQDVIKSSEPIFNDLTGEGLLDRHRAETGDPNMRAAINDGASCEADIAQFHLEPDPSDVLANFCVENNISMVCLILMALRTYMQKMNHGESDVSIQSTISRRATLAEKKSGGSRIHFFPCRTVVGLDKTFLEGCRIIQQSQNSMFRHANFNPIEYMTMRSRYYKNKPGETYESISLTYQPLSVRTNKDLPDIKYKSSWYSNGVAAQPLYLTVMHRSLDNGLDFSFEYKKGKYTYEQLEKIYYYVTRIIFDGVLHPNKTVAEIIANA